MTPTPGHAPRPADRGIAVLSAVLVYAVFAAIWILLSDRALGWLFDAPQQIALASTYKGWFFVAVTSLLLYVLLTRITAAAPDAPTPRALRDAPRLLLPFLVLSAAIVTLTTMVVAHTYTHQRDQELARLHAIARLKSRQITDWLRERQADTDFVRTSSHYADLYRHWRDTGDSANRDALMRRLEFLRASRGFVAVSLLDAAGTHLAGDAHAPRTVAPPLAEAARQAAADGRVRRVGPYLGMAGQTRLDFITPLALSGPRPGIVVLHGDTAGWLRRTLDDWPNPSASGEALLIRRDGDRILHLSESRHGKDLAMRRRMPVSAPDMLAGPVLRGEAKSGSLLTGVDYRGQPVLGVVHAIPDSDWFLVAKVDRAEVRARAWHDAVWIGLAGLLALLITGAGFHLLRQRQQLIIADSVRQSQDERLRALHLLAAIADSSEDGVFAQDPEGRFILFNRAAGRIIGVAPEAALGRTGTAVFPAPLADRMRELDREALAANAPRPHEATLSQAGNPLTVELTKAPLHDETGKTIGLFGIVRDVTERKRAEAALRAQSELLNEMSALAHIGGWALDPETETISWTAEVARIHDLTECASVDMDSALDYYCPEHRPSLDRALREALELARPFDLELELLSAAGQRKWVRNIGHPARVDGKVVEVRGSLQDITRRKRAEASLRDSESRFRALVEQSLAGIYIIQDDRFRYVNPGFAAIFGYDAPEQLIDRVAVRELVAPADRERVADNIRRRLELQTTDIHYTYVGVRRDGRHIDVEVHGTAFEYQGRPAVIGLMLDVTARKAAEDALRASERRFHDIVNASADWIWEVDAEGRLTYASESVRDLLGYSAAEILGKTPFDLMPPDEAARVGAEFAAFVAQRAAFRDLENITLRKDGRPVRVSTNGTPILDAAGKLLGYRGLDRDISAKKLAEDELAEREARYRAVIETAGDGFWMLDERGCLLAVNEAYTRRSGYSRGELLGMRVTDLDAVETPEAVLARIEKIRRQGGDLFETRHRAKDGQIWPVEVTVAYWAQAGGHYFVFLRDITQRKADEEELKRRNTELERFNRATVGRELDMIEMKQRINALSRELGREPPYPLAFLDDGAGEV